MPSKRSIGVVLSASMLSACWMIAGLDERSPTGSIPGDEGGIGSETGSSGGDSPNGTDGPTTKIQGTAIDLAGVPVAQAIVHVGSQTATTDPKGAFTIDAPTVPYDITVEFPIPTNAVSSGKALATFVGLSTLTPTLQSDLVALASNNVEVEVTVSGAGTDLGANQQVRLAFETPSGGAGLGGTSLPVTGQVKWVGPTSFNGKLFGVVATIAGGSGLPTTIDLIGERPYGLTTNGPLVLDITVLSTTPKGMVTGTITFPSGWSLGNWAAYLDPSAGSRAAFGAKSPAPANTFQFATLATTGASAGFSVTGRDGAVGPSAVGSAEVWSMGLSPSATGVAMVVPAPPELLTPTARGVTDPATTTFTWKPMPASVHHLDVVCFAGASTVYRASVFLMGATAKLPSTLPLTGVTTCDWSVNGYAASSMSDLVGPTGWVPRSSASFGARISGHAGRTPVRSLSAP